MQEGIASEAASLAGHLQLRKLVMLYDDNGIQLDGPDRDGLLRGRPRAASTPTAGTPSGSMTATTSRRSARRSERAQEDARPSLIAVRTHIGYGSPHKQDSQKAHGSPLGEDEVRLTKEAYGWDPDRHFYVPDEALASFRRAMPDRRGAGRGVEGRVRALRADHPDLAAEFERRLAGDLPDGWDAGLPSYAVGEDFATRQVSQAAINALAGRLPGLFGGAADLSESNLTDIKGAGDFAADEPGPEPALRRPRARDGRDRQRDRLPRRLPPVLRHVPDLQRLHARLRPPGGAGRPARDLRLDPRLGRPRRGRPDPPAGRAADGSPGDPEPVVRPAGRRQRGRRRVGPGDRAARRPGRPRPDPPEADDPARDRRRPPGTASGAAATSCASRAAARTAIDLILIATGSELGLAARPATCSKPTGSGRAW